jgi:hypothetical protein
MKTDVYAAESDEIGCKRVSKPAHCLAGQPAGICPMQVHAVDPSSDTAGDQVMIEVESTHIVETSPASPVEVGKRRISLQHPARKRGDRSGNTYSSTIDLTTLV